jgi:hypothetical protein
MDGIATLTGTGGAVLLARTRHAESVPATYIRRLSGSILLAFGIILFAFSTAYAVATR